MEKLFVLQQLDLGSAFENVPLSLIGNPVGSPVIIQSNSIDNRRRTGYKPFSSVFISIESSYIPIICSLTIEYSNDGQTWFGGRDLLNRSCYWRSSGRIDLLTDMLVRHRIQPAFRFLSNFSFEFLGDQIPADQQNILFTGSCLPPTISADLFKYRAVSTAQSIQVFPYIFRFKVRLYTLIYGHLNYVLNDHAKMRIRAYAKRTVFD